MFNSGQLVKCVDGNFTPQQTMLLGLENLPKEGEIYTVYGIDEATSVDKVENNPQTGGLFVKGVWELAVHLKEFPNNPTTKAGIRVGYASMRFEPVEEIDVSEFYKNEEPIPPKRELVEV